MGRGTYSWPEAAIGQVISHKCQYGNISRVCNADLTWTEDASGCLTVVTKQFNELSTDLKNVQR